MATPQRFFRLKGAPRDAVLPPGFDLITFSPKLTRLYAHRYEQQPPLPLYLFWFLASNAGYQTYYVEHRRKAVHVSHVLSRSFKFPFMSKGELHIGPCWTAAEFRGRGIFPAVLSRIARDNPGKTFWMLTDESNVSSQRGIMKAGFQPVGTGVRARGIYRLTNPDDQAR